MTARSIETNTGCLLVVDDQESNIQVVGAALGKLGFEILPATGGLQAFQRLAVRRPDLILLDLLMPGMDGFERRRRIGDAGPHAPGTQKGPRRVEATRRRPR